jgi:hypothetical protein
MGKTKIILLPLVDAIVEWADMQTVVGDTVILVRDFHYSEGRGIIVKVNDEEPEGIDNPYYCIPEIENDLARVVPGYVKGSAVWQEGEYEY